MTVPSTKKRIQANAPPATLDDYLALPYRLEIVGDGSETFVVSYPELPGCFSQVEAFEDVRPVARELLTGWLEIALEDGQPIPLPRQTEDYGGRVLVRMPKSLHRWLVETAEEENVSLNARIVSLLASSRGSQALSQHLDQISAKLDALQEQRAEPRSTAIRSVT
jgi:antitoxin HicB